MELHGGRWWQHLEVRRDEGAPNGGVEEYKVLVGADVQRLRFQCPPKRAPVKALVAMHHVLCVDWKSGQVDVLQQQGCCRPPTASTQQPSARLGFEEGVCLCHVGAHKGVTGCSGQQATVLQRSAAVSGWAELSVHEARQHSHLWGRQRPTRTCCVDTHAPCNCCVCPMQMLTGVQCMSLLAGRQHACLYGIGTCARVAPEHQGLC